MTISNTQDGQSFPRHSKGSRPKFFDVEGVDEVMSMVLVLSSEFCAMRDRMDTIEKIAAEKGLFLDEEIEKFQPDPETVAAREQRRNKFLQRLYYVTLKQAEEQKTKDSSEKYKSTIRDIAEN